MNNLHILTELKNYCCLYKRFYDAVVHDIYDRKFEQQIALYSYNSKYPGMEIFDFPAIAYRSFLRSK